MTDKTIDDLTAITTPDEADEYAVDDVSVPQTKKITHANLRAAILSHTSTLTFSVGGSTRLSLNTTDFDATVNIRGNGGSTGHAAIAPSSSDPDTGLKATVANELRLVAGDVDTLIVKTTDILGASNVNVRLQGTGEYLYNTARSTTVLLDPTEGFAINSTAALTWGMRTTTNQGIISQANTGLFRIPLHLPHGSVITSIKAMVKPGAVRSTTNRVEFNLRYVTPNFGTPADPTVNNVFSVVEDDGTTNIQNLPSGAISHTVDKANNYWIYLRSGSDGGTNKDLCYSIQVTYDDLGPRNY